MTTDEIIITEIEKRKDKKKMIKETELYRLAKENEPDITLRDFEHRIGMLLKYGGFPIKIEENGYWWKEEKDE